METAGVAAGRREMECVKGEHEKLDMFSRGECCEFQTPLSLKEFPSGTIRCSVILNTLTFTSSPGDLATRHSSEAS